MCKAVEDYAKEYAKEYSAVLVLEDKIETIKNMLKENIPLETALKCAQLDKETYEKHIQDTQ